MSQHTATARPWKALYVPSGMPTECCKYGIIGPNGLETCRVWKQEDVRYIERAVNAYDANQQLIAKLVEALENLFALVQGECPSLLENDHHYDMVKAALDLARPRAGDKNEL